MDDGQNLYLCSRDPAPLQGSLGISTGVPQDAGLELVLIGSVLTLCGEGRATKPPRKSGFDNGILHLSISLRNLRNKFLSN